MNRDKWTFNQKGTLEENNDANDYYYSWIEANIGEDNHGLEWLFSEFLGVGFDKTNIRVKAREGAIFIVKEGDEDDKPNKE